MILIAESGSSKTDWRLLREGGIVEGEQTLGLNPHHHSVAEFEAAIENSVVMSWSKLEIDKIFFYGSGVTGEDMNQELEVRFRIFFSKSKLYVASDLIGAARALFKNKSGLVGILGTGSNSGWYDGRSITKNIPPLGYVLGDEGSGNALGRRLITEFLRNNLPANIKNEFVKFYPKHQQLIASIYRDSQTSRLLASFTPFIHEFKDDEFMSGLIQLEFSKYFELLQGYEAKSKISLVGSIAYYFKDTLTKVALKKGIKLGEIIKSPIDALTLYHKPKNL